MPEVALLTETMVQVREAKTRGEWRQREWGSKILGCGTAYCFAGWRVVLDGGRLTAANTFVLPDGTELHATEVGDYARERLGLTRRQADSLFDVDNNINDLEHWVGVLIQ